MYSTDSGIDKKKGNMTMCILKIILMAISLVMAWVSWKKSKKPYSGSEKSTSAFIELLATMKSDPKFDQTLVVKFDSLYADHQLRSMSNSRASWILLSLLWVSNALVCVCVYAIVLVAAFGLIAIGLSIYDMHKFYVFIKESDKLFEEICSSASASNSPQPSSPNEIREENVES